MRSSVYVVLLGLALVCTSCGSGASGNAPGSYGNGSSSSGGASSKSTPAPVAVTPPPGLPSVSYSLSTFPQGNPCSMPATSAFSTVPNACQLEWAPTGTTYVPGEDAMKLVPAPSSATYQQGVSSAQAQSYSQAFIRTIELSFWAMKYNNATMLSLLDGPIASGDLILKNLQSGGVVKSLPSCLGPTSVEVVTVSQSAVNYLVSQGWSSPSQVGLVATYPACSGLTMLLTGGRTVTYGASTRPYSIFYTGSIEQVSPFGGIWITNGQGQCGALQLRSAC